jgi:HSP20 family molecular chaperone IbpA
MSFITGFLNKIKNIFNNKDAEIEFPESKSMERMFDSISIEEHDSISEYIEIDNKQVHLSQLANQLEQVPPGIAVPGLGYFGTGQNKNQQQPQPAHVQQQQVNITQDVSVAKPVKGKEKTIDLNTSIIDNKKPYYEMADLNGVYYLFIDLPNVSTLSINIQNGRELNVNGSREPMIKKLKQSHSVKKCNSEFKTVPDILLNNFNFKFEFKNQINTSEIKTTYDKGVFSIELPQLQATDNVEIAIM